MSNIKESALLRSILPEEEPMMPASRAIAKAPKQPPPPKKEKKGALANIKDKFSVADNPSLEDEDGHDIEGTREGVTNGELSWWQKTKIGGLLFFAFIVLSSNVFIEVFLRRWKGTIDVTLNTPTSYGTIIQGILLVLAYVTSDIIVTNGIV